MSHPLADKLRKKATDEASYGADYCEGLREAADEIDMYTEPIVVTYPNDNAVDYLGLVHEFHEKYDHYIGNTQFDGDKYPSYPTDIVKLREKLITEEAKEFADWSYENYDTLDSIPVNIIEIADALADLLYVVFGAAIAYNIPIGEVFKEVHRSNMTKSMLKDEKSIKGKTIKGDKYEPPKIREILERSMK